MTCLVKNANMYLHSQRFDSVLANPAFSSVEGFYYKYNFVAFSYLVIYIFLLLLLKLDYALFFLSSGYYCAAHV